MAATFADRTTASAILKQFYLGPIRSMLNSQTLLMRRLQKREDVWEGEEIVLPLHIGRNPGVMARRENDNLAVSGKQSTTKARWKGAYNYGRITLSGPLLASARSKAGAFIAALQYEVDGVVRDLKKDQNRQLWGDGSGRLGTVQVKSSNTLYTIRGPWDWAGQGNRLQYLNVGDRVAFEDISSGSASSALAANSDEIASLDFDARTITLATGTAASAVGDSLVKAIDTGASAVADTTLRGVTSGAANEKAEMMGLVGICSGSVSSNWPANSYSGTAYANMADGQVYAGRNAGAVVGADLQGVSGSSVPYWRAQTMFNTGVPRPLTTNLLQQMSDRIEIHGEAKASIILTSHQGRAAYADLVIADRRFVNEYKLDGGFSAVDYNGTPMVAEVDCPPGCFFFLSEGNLMICRQSDYYFLDKDGAVFSRVQNKDAYEAILANYSDLATDRRNAQGVLGDVIM